MPDPVRVFVSYASQDRSIAQRLVKSLQAAGAVVWWDVGEIEEGYFLRAINDALQQCQWLVLVLTPSAIASDWVKMEVDAAIHRKKQGFMRGVLPILAAPVHAGTVPPLWDNLHRYDAVNNYDGEIKRLQRTLGLAEQTSKSPSIWQAQTERSPLWPLEVVAPDIGADLRTLTRSNWSLIAVDAPSFYLSLRVRMLSMSSNFGIDLKFSHLYKLEDLKSRVFTHFLAQAPTMLIVGDMGSSPPDALLEYVSQIWQEPAGTWLGNLPIIVYTSNAFVYKQLKRRADTVHRSASAVILQTPTVGANRWPLIQDALSSAIGTFTSDVPPRN